MSEPSSRRAARRVLIAGCGYVGSALATHLHVRGDAVFALRRSPTPLGEGIGTIALDLSAEIPDALLPDAIDTVVYAASADERSLPAYRRAYVDGPTRLATYLRLRGDPLRRFVLLSSTGVYGQTDGSWVDESTPTQGHGTGAVLAEGEQMLLAQTPQAVVLRLGGIYGPGRRNLIDRVLAGMAGCPEGAPVFTNRIHLDDIVAAIDHILTLDAPERIYLGVDDEPADTCTVVHWLATATGAPEAARIGAGAERANKRCRNERLRASGFDFRYPTFRHGYRSILQQLGLLRGDAPL